MNREFFEIEGIIGYTFKNRDLLLRALTHPSYANEHNLESYDRLEFVGDSILDFVIADELYKRYRHENEGALTKMRAGIVSREPLAIVVKKHHFDEYMLVSVGHRQLSTKEYSNIFESLVAAIYYDGGLYEAKKFIIKYLEHNIKHAKSSSEDSKSLLQEYVQERQLGEIHYSIVSHDFENNIHTFVMQVDVAGHSARGEGKNRQAGEKQAARKMLEMLRHK